LDDFRPVSADVAFGATGWVDLLMLGARVMAASDLTGRALTRQRVAWDHQSVSRIGLTRFWQVGFAVSLAVAVVVALAPYRTSVQFVNGDQVIHVASKCGPPIVYAFKKEPRGGFLGGSGSSIGSVRGINCRTGGRKRMVAATIALAAPAAFWVTGRERRRESSNR
jgi:hypothetical protein